MHSRSVDGCLLTSCCLTDFGVTKTLPLIRDGDQIPVTKENRLEYIFLMSNYRLNKQIKQQSDAFFEGLSEIIDPKWLRFVSRVVVLTNFSKITLPCSMFNQQELQILLGGVNSPIDLEDLRANTQYGGLYNDQEPTVQMFWRVRVPCSSCCFMRGGTYLTCHTGYWHLRARGAASIVTVCHEL